MPTFRRVELLFWMRSSVIVIPRLAPSRVALRLVSSIADSSCSRLTYSTPLMLVDWKLMLSTGEPLPPPLPLLLLQWG